MAANRCKVVETGSYDLVKVMLLIVSILSTLGAGYLTGALWSRTEQLETAIRGQDLLLMKMYGIEKANDLLAQSCAAPKRFEFSIDNGYGHPNIYTMFLSSEKVESACLECHDGKGGILEGVRFGHQEDVGEDITADMGNGDDREGGSISAD